MIENKCSLFASYTLNQNVLPILAISNSLERWVKLKGGKKKESGYEGPLHCQLSQTQSPGTKQCKHRWQQSPWTQHLNLQWLLRETDAWKSALGCSRWRCWSTRQVLAALLLNQLLANMPRRAPEGSNTWVPVIHVGGLIEFHVAGFQPGLALST